MSKFKIHNILDDVEPNVKISWACVNRRAYFRHLTRNPFKKPIEFEHLSRRRWTNAKVLTRCQVSSLLQHSVVCCSACTESLGLYRRSLPRDVCALCSASGSASMLNSVHTVNHKGTDKLSFWAWGEKTDSSVTSVCLVWRWSQDVITLN